MSANLTLGNTNDENREIVCNRCNHTTKHIVACSLNSGWGNDDIRGYDDYEVIRCLGCDSVSFRIGSTSSDDVDYDPEKGQMTHTVTELIYPNRLMGRPQLDSAYLLPSKIRVMYKEAHSALCSGMKILAGIAIRCLVEAICIEESSKGRTLEKKINDLVVREFLTGKNAGILHKMRFLGNKSVHEIEAATDKELDISFDIIENILETAYIIPQKADQLNF